MRMLETMLAAGGMLLCVPPAHAKTIDVPAGADAQQRLQEALIVAEPGDTVSLAAGRFALTDGLSLDVKGVTVRGAGPDATILDFSGQEGAGEGLLVTSSGVTLRDFAVENPQGDGIKSKDADDIVFYRIRVTWTGGPKATNGAYGIYPVESTGVLIEQCRVEGASDAGIYVGQSKDITVRYSVAEGNVAGIEIENSRNALVTGNLVSRNTGGILVFDLPNLKVMGGGNTLVAANYVIANDTPNFAPKGNIVAGVPRGTGVMVMANDHVSLVANTIVRNPTAGVLVVAYPNAFDDKRYNPYPRHVAVGPQNFDGNGSDPQMPGKDQLLAAFGGTLPPVVWDGLGGKDALKVYPGIAAISLNLPQQGAGPELARPGPLEVTGMVAPVDPETVGAPASLDARINS